MGKNLGEIINNIMEENSSNRVAILTNHLYIIGTIHDYHEKCANCHECLIGLKDVKIANLRDLSRCSQEDCECNSELFASYRWFNINANEIVGFSIIGMSEE